MSNFYNSIPILKTKRCKYNLSYTHKTTCDMGMLIPIGSWLCYPNEKYKIGNQAIIRMQPLAAPLMHRIKIKVAAFFIPWRIVWDEYEDWANSGRDGSDLLTKSLPLWDDYYQAGEAPPKYSLWDYFARNALAVNDATKDPDMYWVPNDLMRRAYNRVYNEYFANRNVEANDIAEDNNNILFVNFKNDYFASALPFQQRGVTPAIAMSLNDAPVVWDINTDGLSSGSDYIPADTNGIARTLNSANQKYNVSYSGGVTSLTYLKPIQDMALRGGQMSNGANSFFSKKIDGKRVKFENQNKSTSSESIINIIPDEGSDELTTASAPRIQTLGMRADNSNLASTFDTQQLRMLVQMQKFLERNARSGSRYSEQLLGRWGVFAGDARLQRPEFIYSTTNTIAVEDLPQLSEDGNTPQGHLVGKGTGAQINSKAGYYTTKEHGMILQLMWIVPDLDYVPQGYDRETLIHTRDEEYAPEFAHLSEQMIKKGELYFAGNPDTDNAMFGYEPIWSELRHRRNVVSGDMRDTFDYWHLGRKFANQPALNKSFIQIDGTTQEFKRIFATKTAAQGFIVAFGNECTALRPLPKYGTPGYVDHY